MIDYRFLFGAIAIMLIIIIRDFLKKKYEYDMDNVDVKRTSVKWFRFFSIYIRKIDLFKKFIPENYAIEKNTGYNSLTLTDAGENKATVMATLRQITDLEYEKAKYIVNNVPYTFMLNISDQEAEITKKALEYVGAKVDIDK